MASGLPDAILDLENRHLGTDGEPTLGRALDLAIREWQNYAFTFSFSVGTAIWNRAI
jgi:hypothetical protein